MAILRRDVRARESCLLMGLEGRRPVVPRPCTRPNAERGAVRGLFTLASCCSSTISSSSLSSTMLPAMSTESGTSELTAVACDHIMVARKIQCVGCCDRWAPLQAARTLAAHPGKPNEGTCYRRGRRRVDSTPTVARTAQQAQAITCRKSASLLLRFS